MPVLPTSCSLAAERPTGVQRQHCLQWILNGSVLIPAYSHVLALSQEDRYPWAFVNPNYSVECVRSHIQGEGGGEIKDCFY